jgi:hypothetical protein
MQILPWTSFASPFFSAAHDFRADNENAQENLLDWAADLQALFARLWQAQHAATFETQRGRAATKSNKHLSGSESRLSV